MEKFIIVAITLILTLSLSWAVTVGVLYAISALIGFKFSLGIATAIWLALVLVSGFFRNKGKE